MANRNRKKAPSYISVNVSRSICEYVPVCERERTHVIEYVSVYVLCVFAFMFVSLCVDISTHINPAITLLDVS